MPSLSNITDLVGIAGTLAAIILGVIGLTTWRRQLKGTSEYELAKKTVLLAYEWQASIQYVRNPMLYLSKEEIEAGNRVQEEQRIYNERLQKLYAKWAEVQTARLECKVIWGNEAFEKFSGMQDLVGTMRAEIWLHFWLKGAYASPGATVDNKPERIQRNNEVVYLISDEDPFSLQIHAAVEVIEKYFSSKIRSK